MPVKTLYWPGNLAELLLRVLPGIDDADRRESR
jgi:hypothetical protein